MRALLFDGEGNLLGSAKQELEPYFSTQPGWAEQHPQYFWDALGQACQQLWQETAANPAQVKGVTLTTQRGTVVNLDVNGTPLRPAIIWLDQRHADASAPLPVYLRWPFRLLGLAPTIQRFRENCQANWIAQNQPDVWRDTRYFLLTG